MDRQFSAGMLPYMESSAGFYSTDRQFSAGMLPYKGGVICWLLLQWVASLVLGCHHTKAESHDGFYCMGSQFSAGMLPYKGGVT